MKKKRTFGKNEHSETGTNSAPASVCAKKRVGLSKKALIILLCVLGAVAIAVGITVPVVLSVTSKVPSPIINDFNQASDVTVTVSWDRVASAEAYYYQYCVGDPKQNEKSIVSGSTQNAKVTLPRCKGKFYFRVKAIFSTKDGDYSDWIMFEIDEMLLPSPEVVTIDENTLLVSWTKGKYWNEKSETNYSDVPSYSYSFALVKEGEEIEWSDEIEDSTTGFYAYYYIVNKIASLPEYEDYYAGFDDEWPGNLVFSVRVRSCNYSLYVATKEKNIDKDSNLYRMYAEKGEYAYATLVITKEVYDAFPKKS